jgi:hypothetical protein
LDATGSDEDEVAIPPGKFFGVDAFFLSTVVAGEFSSEEANVLFLSVEFLEKYLEKNGRMNGVNNDNAWFVGVSVDDVDDVANDKIVMQGHFDPTRDFDVGRKGDFYYRHWQRNHSVDLPVSGESSGDKDRVAIMREEMLKTSENMRSHVGLDPLIGVIEDQDGIGELFRFFRQVHATLVRVEAGKGAKEVDVGSNGDLFLPLLGFASVFFGSVPAGGRGVANVRSEPFFVVGLVLPAESKERCDDNDAVGIILFAEPHGVGQQREGFADACRSCAEMHNVLVR